MKDNLEKISVADFDPDGVGIANGNFFGFPCDEQDADFVIIPIPWDATVSYGAGTAEGPRAMLEASLQVDLYDEKIRGGGDIRVWTAPESETIAQWNGTAREAAVKVIDTLAEGGDPESVEAYTEVVNKASDIVNSEVEKAAEQYLAAGKTPIIVGGEHSCPFGLLRALGKHYENFGILHIDAHSDTRKAYEGFTYSHASIMYNAINRLPAVGHITQVAIRDFCAAEHRLITENPKFSVFSDYDIHKALYEGENWKSICDRIIDSLPQNVYISFDIDGLTPDNCPGTGTPVPGGLTFSQADYMLHRLAVSGKRIIASDLCEVAPGDDEWDANVGARMLFKLLVYSRLNRQTFEKK